MSDDQFELRQLAERYAQAVDRRDADALVKLFTADGMVSAAQTHRGTGALRAMVQRIDEMYARTRHEISTAVYEVDGDAAVGDVYGVAHHLTSGPGAVATDHVLYLRYRDRCRSDEGVWRFEERRMFVDFAESRSVELPAG